MNLKLVMISTACLSYILSLAAGTSLVAAAAAVKGAVIGTGLPGAVFSSSSSGDGTVVIQTQPGTIAVEAVPAPVEQVIVQQPVEYKPIQTISLVPVATIASTNSFAHKLSWIWGGISNAINNKTRVVGDFLRSLRGPPRVVFIKVNTTTTSTTTTTQKPVVIEIIAEQPQRFYPLRVPVV